MIKVRVAATTANLGPGFDTLGLALKLYNTFLFEEIDGGLEILGLPAIYNNKDNLIYQSMLRTFKKIGYKEKGIRINVEADIPVSRGLGSSASCIVAGIVGASELANIKLTKDQILEIATEIEGHPDNVAPAIFGGLVVSILDGEKILYNKMEISKAFRFVALIPDFTLSTEKSRSVLPELVRHKDAVDNVGRVSLLLSALANGRLDLIKYGLKDNLHEPYRGVLVKNYFNIIEKCQELGIIGTYLSGAGPTIMCLLRDEDLGFERDIERYLANLDGGWKVKSIDLEEQGFQLL